MDKKGILIVEDSTTVAEQLKDLITAMGYTCVGIVKTGEEAIEMSKQEDVDVILMDIWLEGELNGLQAATVIGKKDEKPVIFLTSSSDMSLMDTLKISNGSSFMVKPVNGVELQFNIELSLIKAENNRLLKNQKRWQEAILESVVDGVIAEDEEGKISYINTPGRNLLGIKGDYIGKKTEDYFHAFIKETGEPVEDEPTNGNVECRIVTHLDKHYSVIMKIANILTARGEYLGRAVTLTNISDEIELQGRVNFLTFHDSMTGLYNRNYLDEEIDRLNTTRQLPISIIMADLNGLKIANDLMGHAEGDEVIRMSADVLRNATRTEDIVARIGGDEFMIFLPETSAEEAEIICQRILSSSQRRMTKLGPLSLAVGHYTKYEAAENIRLCMTKADEDMYAKKSQMKAKFYDEVFNHLYRKMTEHPYEGMKIVSKVRDIMAEMCLLDPLTRPFVKEAVMLSEVYDIGMICLDEDVYQMRIFSDNDKKMTRRHCETGTRISELSPHYSRVSKYILYHHHRYDGLGSTDSVKGDAIPLLARMLAVADSFVAMTGDRLYREPMTIKQAAKEVAKGSGNQFDPWVVDLFFKAVHKMGLDA